MTLSAEASITVTTWMWPSDICQFFNAVLSFKNWLIKNPANAAPRKSDIRCCMCKKQLFVLLQLVIIPCVPKSKRQEPCTCHREEEAAGEWKPWGARCSPPPYHIVFCFQLTRINKLIISVVVVMGYSLLATSYNMLVTFIIFRDILCETLKQGVLGNALCKDSRNVCLLPFQLFIFLSVISGFYAGFLVFLLTYFPLCSFLTYFFSFFPPSLGDFLFSI